MNAHTISASNPPSARRRPLREALRSAGAEATRRLFLDRQAEFWLDEVAPLRSRTELRARVVRIENETHDAKTFVLEPNGLWTPHHAGQFTTVEVEIEGVRVRRCYSISSAPGAPNVSITVKRVPGGRVSGWLHDHLRRGDVLRLSPPAGEFVLPEGVDAQGPGPLLFIAAGSGVTPFLSMARDLAAREQLTDVAMVYYARSAADVIGGEALRELAAQHPGFRVHMLLDDATEGAAGFDGEHLLALVPDLPDRSAYLCGPSGLMSCVEAFWEKSGITAALTRESFTLPSVTASAHAALGEQGTPRGVDTEVDVRLTRTGRSVVARGGGSLLEQLERAGERPAHGCRMGICQTCRCLKKSGTVRNLLTGAVSSEPDVHIQICVSAASSDLELEL